MARFAYVYLAFSIVLLLFLYGCPAQQAATSKAAVCGNGALETGEMCEKNEDCKDSLLFCTECACKVKPSVAAKAVPNNAETQMCGNGKLETGEECEKGVVCTKNGTVCDEAACKCKAEEKKEEPAPVCGNGVKETGEACEKDGDCGSGFVCSECACKAKPSVVEASACGNTKLDTGEECELGTVAAAASFNCPSGEYCSNCKCYTAAEPISCKSNHQYQESTGLNKFIWTTLPSCGDDCNYLGLDYKCDLTTCTCVKKTVTSHTCGNNIKEPMEDCDGYDNSYCNSDEICGSNCECINGSRGVCGNDVREGNEQCDGADRGVCTANQVCTSNCICQNQVASVCGNNVREGAEQCDGTDRGTCSVYETCSANCACIVQQQQTVCGNNVREGAEQCDGSDRTACTQSQTCNQQCVCQIVQPQQVCGNNVREGTEICDGTDKSNCPAGYACNINCACACPDADVDGVCDAQDNCPNNYNPGQGDQDADGIGDVCDPVPVSCPAECSGIGLTVYALGANNQAVCDAKIQLDMTAAMAALTSETCFTTCKYAETNSTYLTINMNQQVIYGCCCLGPVHAWKEQFACTNCPAVLPSQPICPPAAQVCRI